MSTAADLALGQRGESGFCVALGDALLGTYRERFRGYVIEWIGLDPYDVWFDQALRNKKI